MARGRPKLFSVTVSQLSLTQAQYDGVKAYADAYGVNRLEAIRKLVEAGLRSMPPRTCAGDPGSSDGAV